jgi:hypothetical protein
MAAANFIFTATSAPISFYGTFSLTPEWAGAIKANLNIISAKNNKKFLS